MPWDVVQHDNAWCVIKKTTGKTMHCYTGEGAEQQANDYLAALHMHAYKELQDDIGVYASKEANEDGSYNIISISTVARRDKEGETFTTEAMDFDAQLAVKTGKYPEYRLFHKKSLAFGIVTKMSRIGDYAIEEGKSYTDPFSLAVCKDLLQNNNGKWKNSRGFYVLEATGGCPVCKSILKVSYKHMIAGFYCPVCKSLQADFRDELVNTYFTKTKTFDITVTDHPAVPWTATIAYRDIGDTDMTKTQLRKKMLAAKMDPDVVEERLKEIDGEVLKELGNDLPFAQVLKEIGLEETEEETTEEDDTVVEKEETFEIDDETLDDLATRVVDRIVPKMKEMLEGAAFDVDGLDELPVELKELDNLVERIDTIQETVVALKEAIDSLLEAEDTRMSRKLKETPRNGKLRIIRRAKAMDEEDDMEEEEDDEEDMPMKGKQHIRPAFRTFGNGVKQHSDTILDGQGKEYKSLTDMITE